MTIIQKGLVVEELSDDPVLFRIRKKENRNGYLLLSGGQALGIDLQAGEEEECAQRVMAGYGLSPEALQSVHTFSESPMQVGTEETGMPDPEHSGSFRFGEYEIVSRKYGTDGCGGHVLILPEKKIVFGGSLLRTDGVLPEICGGKEDAFLQQIETLHSLEDLNADLVLPLWGQPLFCGQEGEPGTDEFIGKIIGQYCLRLLELYQTVCVSPGCEKIPSGETAEFLIRQGFRRDLAYAGLRFLTGRGFMREAEEEDGLVHYVRGRHSLTDWVLYKDGES